MSHWLVKLCCEMSETESLNGFKKKLGSTCEFLSKWLLNIIIWLKYVAENFKNFMIIKLQNNRCAKKRELFSKCHLMLCCWRQTSELCWCLVCLNRSEGFLLHFDAGSLIFQLACLYLDDGAYWTKVFSVIEGKKPQNITCSLPGSSDPKGNLNVCEISLYFG